MGNRLFVQQTVNNTAFVDVYVHDLRHVFRLNPAIECAFGINDHDGSHFAEAVTARLHDLDFGFESLQFQFLFQ